MPASLRPLEDGDAARLWEWAQDRDLHHLTGAWPDPPRTVADMLALVQGWRQDPSVMPFAIVVHDRMVGNCWLGHITDDACSLGISIAPGYQDRGYGTEVMRLLLERAGTRRVDLWVYADNARAAAVYRKVGFAEMGRGERDGRPVITMSREPG